MSTVQDTPRVGTRTFFVGAVVVCLLVAAVASFYASAHPDGLEFVAEQTGFLHAAEDSATAGSPFADYQTSGIDNPRLSGGRDRRWARGTVTDCTFTPTARFIAPQLI